MVKNDIAETTQNSASSIQFKTLTETEVLRRQHSLMLKLWAGSVAFAFSVILIMVLTISYFNSKSTNSIVNGMARSVKYIQE